MQKPLEVLRRYAAHNYTLHAAFSSRAARDPQREFIFFNGTSWSWQVFGTAVERTARLFLSRGIRKGDRVAVMARNCDGHPLALFALARIGAIMVPVNPEFGVTEAKYVFHHAEVSAVLAASDTLTVARQAAGGLATPPWFALFDNAQDGVPLLSELAASAPNVALPADITAEIGRAHV